MQGYESITPETQALIVAVHDNQDQANAVMASEMSNNAEFVARLTTPEAVEAMNSMREAIRRYLTIVGMRPDAADTIMALMGAED